MYRIKLAAVFTIAGFLFACGGELNTAPNTSNKTSIKDYETAREIFWSKLYRGRVSSLYCGDSFSSHERRGYNVEHVFPMSWVATSMRCGKRKQCRKSSVQFNFVEADLHNLYPTRADVNKERSSYAFGIVNGERRVFGDCDFEVNYRSRVAEPAESVRGDVARAMFYMAFEYRKLGLRLFTKQRKLLYDWHLQDPPSREEVRRNDIIENIQGNRNPFIDDPSELTRLIKANYFRSR